jgi:hypothetical protein
VHQNGTWLIDYNGNFDWDGPSTDKLIFFGGPRVHASGGRLEWVGDNEDRPPTDQVIFFGGPGQTPMVGKW